MFGRFRGPGNNCPLSADGQRNNSKHDAVGYKVETVKFSLRAVERIGRRIRLLANYVGLL